MPLTFLQPKCKLCEKTVYLVDQLRADGVVYHRACFRCNHCKGTLKLGNYASLEGVLYCKPHFDQLLKQTGSFDKSFDQQGCMKRQPATSQSFQRSSSRGKRVFGGTREKCIACGKTVYPIDKTTVENLPYHKSCFKCAHGGCTISQSNYASLEGRLYCKHHYSQLFKEKGNYSQLTKTPAMKPTTSDARILNPPALHAMANICMRCGLHPAGTECLSSFSRIFGLFRLPLKMLLPAQCLDKA